tara:strand:+ start:169 stop:831 length:663 start_codon:yes stop_codon:yes gene_type:complete
METNIRKKKSKLFQNTKWEPKHIKHIKLLWSKGLTAADIAKELTVFGLNVSRGSVLGVVQRHSLPKKRNKEIKRAKSKRKEVDTEYAKKYAAFRKKEIIKLFHNGDRQYFWSEKLRSMKHTCKKKRLKFDLDIEYLDNLWVKQSGKCNLTNVKLKIGENRGKGYKRDSTMISFDRINNSSGYVKGNIQIISEQINYMKANFSNEEFLSICEKIYLNKQHH